MKSNQYSDEIRVRAQGRSSVKRRPKQPKSTSPAIDWWVKVVVPILALVASVAVAYFQARHGP